MNLGTLSWEVASLDRGTRVGITHDGGIVSGLAIGCFRRSSRWHGIWSSGGCAAARNIKHRRILGRVDDCQWPAEARCWRRRLQHCCQDPAARSAAAAALDDDNNDDRRQQKQQEAAVEVQEAEEEVEEPSWLRETSIEIRCSDISDKCVVFGAREWLTQQVNSACGGLVARVTVVNPACFGAGLPSCSVPPIEKEAKIGDEENEGCKKGEDTKVQSICANRCLVVKFVGTGVTASVDNPVNCAASFNWAAWRSQR